MLVRGRIAEPEPAAELVDELESQMDSALSEYPKHERMGLMEERLLRSQAELEARIAEMMAQQARHINQATGIILAGLTLAVGLILGLG
ncbi:MAG: hypothetical protein OXS30_10695 [Chloroflexota bacterium]|nr:hypothetical protein [Chloroflexota bacterium]